MAYYISVAVNRDTIDLLEDWIQEFQNYTGVDPADDPKAQFKQDTWSNWQFLFTIGKEGKRLFFDNEERANQVIENLMKNVPKAYYYLKETKARHATY